MEQLLEDVNMIRDELSQYGGSELNEEQYNEQPTTETAGENISQIDGARVEASAPLDSVSTFKLSVVNLVNIRLLETIIPKSITLCDESGNIEHERTVYLLLEEGVTELSIGKDHRVGNRVYGFPSKYPVYCVLSM